MVLGVAHVAVAQAVLSSLFQEDVLVLEVAGRNHLMGQDGHIMHVSVDHVQHVYGSTFVQAVP